MAHWIRWFPLLCLIFIQNAWASEQCEFKGQKYVVIEFKVVGDSNTLQSLVLDESGVKEHKTLWYTGSSSINSNYFFNEPALKQGTPYQIRIINDVSGAVPTRYYRKNLNSASSSWNLVEKRTITLKPGNIIGSTDIQQAGLTCADVDEENISSYIPPVLELCQYFPQSIQSWKTKGTIYENYGPSVFTAHSGSEKISGWSSSYINDERNIFTYQPWYGAEWRTLLRIGFDNTYNSNTYYATCQGLGCGTAAIFGSDNYGVDDGLYESRKSDAPEPLNVSFDSTNELVFNGYASEDYNDAFCVSGRVRLCQYVDTGDHIELTVFSNLKKLDVSNSYRTFQVTFAENVNIERFIASDSSRIYFPANSTVVFGTLLIGGNGGAQVYLGSNTTVGVAGDNNDSSVDFEISNPITFTPIATSDGSTYARPYIYGPAASFHFKAKNTIEAYLLAKYIKFDMGISVKGSITAHNLEVVGNVTVIRDDQAPDCWDNETEVNYTLVLTPTASMALACSDLTATLSVMSDGALATDFSGSASVTIDGIKQNVAVNNGTVNITLSSGGASKTVAVTASLVDHSDVASVSGSYQFVPYTFKVDDHYVIANKPQTVTAQAMACSNGSAVDAGYSGSPSAQREWVIPTNGVGEVIYAPQFSQGQASAELTLQDAGQATITLQDSNFDCTGFDSCPFNGSDTLTGQFTIYSRPWTFALCSPTGSAMDGDISDKNSLGFAAAGEAFALNIRPLRWVTGGSDSDPVNGSDEIDTSAYCNAPVTENFFAANSVTANVELSYEVAQPAGGADGTLSGMLTKPNNEGTNNSYLAFSDLSWSEAGVLRVKADTAANYLQMNVNLGYRDIGRFYPAYFAITQADWWVEANDAALDPSTATYVQDNTAYLSQPFGLAEFEVTPYSLAGAALQNYGDFSTDLQASLAVLADADIGDRLSVTAADGAWLKRSQSAVGNVGSWYLNDDKAVFDRDLTTVTCHGRNCRKSAVDGPFNVSDDSASVTTAFGFTVKKAIDDVDSRSSTDTACLNATGSYSSACDLSFPIQPPARYGRMVMSDVGGTSSCEINIPLKVEYWNGTRFVTNSDDSRATYHPGATCRQTIWSDVATSNAHLTSSNIQVTSGENNALKAYPHSTNDSQAQREQMRFWLRLDDDSSVNNAPAAQVGESGVTCDGSYADQPWLQYNWRDQGDEDPSAVVTFGVYRGNDRIIFRGESGLTGQ